MSMKYVTIISPGEMDEPIVSLFLVSPITTTADILNELKLWGYVLFLLSYPARFFDWKEELYERISNGACLYALEPSVADDLCGLSLCTYPEEFAHLFVREVRERRGLLADSQTNSTFNLNQLYQPRGTNHDCKTS
jgi:hypothetical protein